MSGKPLFRRIAIIGFGRFGSSLARAARAQGLVGEIVAGDSDPAALETIRRLGIADHATADLAEAVRGADLVVIAVPVAAYAAVGAAIAPALAPDAIVTDVGSVKTAVVEALRKVLPPATRLVPGHPIAGTEKSGPESGFPELFQGRWCILTPEPQTDPAAVGAVAALWRGVGSDVAEMEAGHHDRVLAITSHLPHLIAYTIVGTAVDLEESLQAEVIKYSASGFRDFTRIAASDPTMWRDIFLNNREAVLDMLQRLNEDIAVLQRAIRRQDGEVLHSWFTRARGIRRGVVEAKQA